MCTELNSSYEISVLWLKMKQGVAGNEKALVAAHSREHYFVIANVTSYF